MSSELDKAKEACGVVGIYAPGEEAAKLAFYSLYALQHRGQESAGIAVADGETILVYKDMGLVSQVFSETVLSSLPGHIALGHTRYSTTGSSRWENAQPTYRSHGGTAVALGHNGNLVNTVDLAREYREQEAGRGGLASSTDSDLIATMIAASARATVEEAMLETLPKLTGAFSIVALDESTLFAARDPHGLRPLVLGRLADGFAVASETCALDIIGARMLREIEPGEVVAIDGDGIRSHRYAEARPSLCIFEYVYLARPDSSLYGKNVYMTRYRMGQKLAEEAPADADLVMPVPDTATAAAAGYAMRSGIPYEEGFVKNRYVGRTFIEPAQAVRERGIRAKLNPLPSVIEGKRLVVVDDSIVRGTTTGQIVRMLKEAGAREVHMRISSPPIKWPCFYGIDIPNRSELIAASKSIDEICASIAADSLDYLSLEGMVASTEVSQDMFCTACFSSQYPIPVPDVAGRSKEMLEEGAASTDPRRSPSGIEGSVLQRPVGG